MIITIILLSITTIVFGFTTWNLLRKNEATEDAIEEQEQVMSFMATKIDESLSKMKELDKIGSFESDDETGFIFKNLYEIISELENYYAEEEKK